MRTTTFFALLSFSFLAATAPINKDGLSSSDPSFKFHRRDPSSPSSPPSSPDSTGDDPFYYDNYLQTKEQQPHPVPHIILTSPTDSEGSHDEAQSPNKPTDVLSQFPKPPLIIPTTTMPTTTVHYKKMELVDPSLKGIDLYTVRGTKWSKSQSNKLEEDLEKKLGMHFHRETYHITYSRKDPETFEADFYATRNIKIAELVQGEINDITGDAIIADPEKPADKHGRS